MDNVYEAALAQKEGAASPANNTPAAPAAGPTPGANAPEPVIPRLPDEPPATSMDIPDYAPPRIDTIGELSEEEKYDLAQQAPPADPPAVPDPALITPDPNAAPPATPPAETGGFDVSEKTGGKFTTVDELIAAAIAPPPAPVEIVRAPEFTNPLAKQAYDLLAAGKVGEVAAIVKQLEFVQTIDTQAPEVVLAARIKEQYPSLTPEQVQYEMNKRYNVKEADFTDDAMGLSVAQAMARDRMVSDSNEAKTYFTNKLGDIKFPELVPVGQPTPAAPEVDLDSPEAKRALDFIGLLPARQPAAKIAFTHTSESPENPITVSGELPLDQGKIQQIKDSIGDRVDLYMLGRWLSKDGSVNVDMAAQDIFVLENLSAMLQQAAGESLNQTTIELLKRSKNYVPDRQTPNGDFGQTAEQQATAQWEKLFGIPPKQPGSPF